MKKINTKKSRTAEPTLADIFNILVTIRDTITAKADVTRFGMKIGNSGRPQTKSKVVTQRPKTRKEDPVHTAMRRRIARFIALKKRQKKWPSST